MRYRPKLKKRKNNASFAISASPAFPNIKRSSVLRYPPKFEKRKNNASFATSASPAFLDIERYCKIAVFNIGQYCCITWATSGNNWPFYLADVNPCDLYLYGPISIF